MDRAYYLSLLWFSLFYVQHVHIGEECELTCRESNNEVVILPSNMTVDSVLREHWRNPHKVKVGLYECLFPPRSSGKRTLQSSAIHNFPVRNFARGVNNPVMLSVMQNADRYFTFAPNAMQMFVLQAWQPFKDTHFLCYFWRVTVKPCHCPLVSLSPIWYFPQTISVNKQVIAPFVSVNLSYIHR